MFPLHSLIVSGGHLQSRALPCFGIVDRNRRTRGQSSSGDSRPTIARHAAWGRSDWTKQKTYITRLKAIAKHRTLRNDSCFSHKLDLYWFPGSSQAAMAIDEMSKLEGPHDKIYRKPELQLNKEDLIKQKCRKLRMWLRVSLTCSEYVYRNMYIYVIKMPSYLTHIVFNDFPMSIGCIHHQAFVFYLFSRQVDFSYRQIIQNTRLEDHIILDIRRFSNVALADSFNHICSHRNPLLS